MLIERKKGTPLQKRNVLAKKSGYFAAKRTEYKRIG